MKKRESRYVYVILLLLAALTVKSLWLDGVGEITGEEADFAKYALQTIESKEKWALNKTDILTYKIVKIVKNDENPTSISFWDQERKERRQVVLSGRYTARVRKYILWILPYGDFSVR